MSSFKTPFNVWVGSALRITAGQALPMGKLEAVVHITGHGFEPRTSRPVWAAAPCEHHCAAPLPVVVPSTTMVPVMCGCKEQK